MRIALAQTDSVLGDVSENLEHAAAAVDKATREHAELVVFPELTLTGYAVGQVDADVSMRADDERLAQLAPQAGSADVLAGFVEDGPGPHTYNSSAYLRAGRVAHLHRKLYLPNYLSFEERKHFSPGQSLRTFQGAGDMRMSVLVCNDAWQPQLAFLAAQDGAEVLLVPTASAHSPHPDRYDAPGYWRDITRFYARMFQLFVVFVNRVGTENGLTFWGGSHVIDPWGEIVYEAPMGVEHLATVELDPTAVRRRRREIPLLKEARLGLIHQEVERLIREGGDK